MTDKRAKELVVKAGIKLVESGLIARTWGNVSCRISEDSFVITPSGRDYLSLTHDEIVTVKISDCSYSGNIKPSSEKGIHAEVYKLYPEINFVIHTHQDNASVISASVLDSIKIADGYSGLAGKVICASYALPGTKKLRRNVSYALSRSKGKAVIMKNHGALCFGKDYDEAFMVASELENACHDFVLNQYLQLSGKGSFDTDEMNAFALSRFTKSADKATDYIFKRSYSSRRTENGFMLSYEDGREVEVFSNKADAFLPKEADAFLPKEADASLPKEAEICGAVYNKYNDINYILYKNTPAISAVSRSVISLRPLLDDFAQIAGTVVKNVEINPGKITAALKKSSVAFIRNNGALCCGKSKEDAVAAVMVTEKACKTLIGASMFGQIKPINLLECILMRFVYLKKYSKQAYKN